MILLHTDHLAVFSGFRRSGIKIGTMDLKMACIAIASKALFLTANQIRQVPGTQSGRQEKSVAWHSDVRSSEKRGIPREFTTASRVIVVSNHFVQRLVPRGSPEPGLRGGSDVAGAGTGTRAFLTGRTSSKSIMIRACSISAGLNQNGPRPLLNATLPSRSIM